jgi:hypothetical protein
MGKNTPWYRHGWGLAAAILLFPLFILWYAWAKSNWSKNIKIGVTAGMAVLFIIFAIAGGSKQEASTTTTTEQKAVQTTQQQPEATKPAKDTSKLNVKVQKAYDVAGIEVTNQEQVNWDSCKLTLNGSYKRTITNPLEPNAPLNNPYGLFTKSDGTRFNPDTTAVKDLFISCSVNGNQRDNYFTF